MKKKFIIAILFIGLFLSSSFTEGGLDEISDCRESINKFLKENLTSYDRFDFEVINLPADAESVVLLASHFEIKSLVSISAEIKLNNGKSFRTNLSIRLQLYKKALIAKTVLEKGTLLKEEFFVQKEIEVNNAKGTPVFSFDEIKNTISKKRFIEGETLIREYIAGAPLIKAGDPVIASVISGGIIISFEAISKQDGAENETIRIVTQDKKLMKAKVIDSKNVLIE